MSDLTHLNVEQAETLLAGQGNVMLLDMRSAHDYAQGHDPRAIHLSDLTLNSLLKHTSKQTHLIFCCVHGQASQDMARLFSDFGFSHCYSLDGGYEGWRIHRKYATHSAEQARHSVAL